MEKEDRIILTVPRDVAQAIDSALEFYARMGLGQLEFLVEEARAGVFKNKEGIEPDHEQLEKAELLVEPLKMALFGFTPTASHGIFSDKISDVFRKVWGAHKALRRRLAWDKNSKGGLGVAFDEPLFDHEKAVTVETSTLAQRLEQLPAGYALTRSYSPGTTTLEWVVFHIEESQVIATSHDLDTAVVKALERIAPKQPGGTAGA
jgi:hypothetical protein